MPKLLIVIASTRPGRVGLPVGEWFYERATAHGGFEPELVDLAVLDLPLLDEPNHPRLQQYTKDHTRAWSETVQGLTRSCSSPPSTTTATRRR
jgi:NAD(P)H-dependent FMN reductase